MGPFCIFAEIRSNSSIKNKLKQLMSNSKISAAAFADTKPHYDLLDGLRGVAALMVIFYHVFEAFATSPIDQQFNHGYLAVDFFFILSGFVIGYAYDDRWKTMTTKDFIKRRLIRLHPMVVLGAVLGVSAFLPFSSPSTPCKPVFCKNLFRETNPKRDKNGTEPQENKIKNALLRISVSEYLLYRYKGTNLSREKQIETPKYHWFSAFFIFLYQCG